MFTEDMDTGAKRINWRKRIALVLKKSSPRVTKRKTCRPNSDDVLLWGQSLHLLLSHKYGRAAFMVFLKSEFCEENLEFWFKCEEFKALTSQKEVESRARSIYLEFVQNEAPKEVNLDFQTRNAVVQGLLQPTPGLFVPAQRRVYSLMENNSYPRFTQSDLYRDLCASAQRGDHNGGQAPGPDPRTGPDPSLRSGAVSGEPTDMDLHKLTSAQRQE